MSAGEQDDANVDGAADAAVRREGGGDADDRAEAALVPRGNPVRWRAAALALASVAALVLLLARDGPVGGGVSPGAHRLGTAPGVLAALALVALATHALLDALGTYDDDRERVVHTVPPGALARPLGGLALALAGGWVATALAVGGWLPAIGAGVAITGAAVALVIAAGRTLEALGVLRPDASGTRVPLRRRHGAWVLAGGAVVTLPSLGSHSLTDPWETHYGEVAREILARGDWISLWWAQDGFFWSKPVLGFWLQALAMAATGVRFEPGGMLSAAADGRTPWPEWAVRLPIAAMAILATYALYRAIARSHGPRAGACAALVLGTMPQWFLVSHQTMADMPFVAALTGAFALALLGLHEDPERRVDLFEVRLPIGGRALRIGGHHLVLGAIVATVLPQIALLVAQNVWVGDRFPPVRLVADTFASGSPGHCGTLPGNDPCATYSATFPRMPPALQAVLWTQLLGLVLGVSWGERRARRLFFLGAWWCAAIATMAKGVAGVALPALCLLLLVVATRRVRDLVTMEIPAGLLLWSAAVLPWFVAMVTRHGMPFVDRLLLHDMVKRALGHVHDTNQGDDVSFRYYVWQLGYATFPWVGIAPAAAVAWMRGVAAGSDETPRGGGPRRTTEVLLALWLVVGFALFSVIQTKFHHYILPVVPALAGLVGIALDRWLARSQEGTAADPAARHADAVRAIVAAGGAALVLLVTRDLAWDPAGGPGPARLMHLFTYDYRRGWPEGIEARPALAAFGVAAALATGAAVVPRLARRAALALAAVAVAFAAWGLDVYLVRASPHWGQRELVLRYVAESRELPGPLVAYQLNWKGENFYSGNDVAAFPSSGRPFREWLAGQRRKGVRTFYVLSLPGRTDTLAAEVGLPARTGPDGARTPDGLERLTTPADNARFVLVRVRYPAAAIVPPPPRGDG